MQTILFYFWQICLLREGPERIPVNTLLTQAICLLYFVVVIVATIITRSDLNGIETLLRALMSMTLEVTLLFSLLRFKQLKERFLQTLTALFGCNSLMLLLTLPINGVQLNLEEGTVAVFFDALYLLCLFWWFAIAGFIFHRAAKISLFQGVVIAISLELLVAYTTGEFIQAIR